MTRKEKEREFCDVVSEWQAPRGASKLEKQGYLEDRAQLRNVLNLYKSDQWEEAKKAAWALDTILRDEIPEAVWEDLNE